ncbi:MAG TPA: hypothetical protein VF610_01670, partial [Segetibacter sp.]
EHPVYMKRNDESFISYKLNALNANVHILSYYYAFVNATKDNIKQNELKFEGIPVVNEGSMNFTTIIPSGGQPSEVNLFIDRVKNHETLKDTFYLTMEYLYKSKGNQTQTPMRKVYFVDHANKQIRDVTSREFYSVALFLKRNKIWSKFYDL